MTTIMQDRLQDRSDKKRTMTSSLLDVIRLLTDRLRLLLLALFPHCSRAGTTTKGDTMTTRVADASCNGTDYNCDVSTGNSDTESTTSADSDSMASEVTLIQGLEFDSELCFASLD